MDLQTVAVALIVPGCAVYAAWKLAPSALKRRAARRLLGAPLPAPIARAVQRAANGAAGCGCDGCDAAPVKPAATTAPITLHRRRP
jgi:hypothetical protein